MHQLKQMKEQLVSLAQSQLSGDIKNVDAKEMGEVIDMIKDLAEATYYCQIVDAMEEKTKEEEIMQKLQSKGEQPQMYYTEPHYNPYRDMDRRYGRMYYTLPYRPEDLYYTTNSGNGTQTTSYTRGMLGNGGRSPYEGRSGNMRRMYMESKEMHKDSKTQMKDLENYLNELAGDITEMIEGATPEQKMALQNKLSSLVSKIQ